MRLPVTALSILFPLCLVLALALLACDDLDELSGTIEIVIATPDPSAPTGTLSAEVRATASQDESVPAPTIMFATSTAVGPPAQEDAPVAARQTSDEEPSIAVVGQPVIEVSVQQQARENLGTLITQVDVSEGAQMKAKKYYKAAQDFMQRRMYREAVEQFDMAIQTYPGYAEAHTDKGQAHSALGQHDQARAAHAKAVELAPDSALVHSYYGQAHHLAGDLAAALTSHNRAVEASDVFTATLTLIHRGQAHAAQGNHTAALADFNAALEADGWGRVEYLYQIYTGLGLSSQSLEDLDAATTNFTLALEQMYQEDGVRHAWAISLLEAAYTNRANVYMRLENHQLALDDYLSAFGTRTGRDSWVAVLNVGRAHMTIGNYKAAQRHYQGALRKTPMLANVPELHVALGLAFAAQGEVEKAGASIRQAETLGGAADLIASARQQLTQ